MILEIGGHSFVFSDGIEPQERKLEIEKCFQEKRLFYAEKEEMTVEEYLSYNSQREVVRNILGRIATYLSKMPEQNGQEDKEVLSKNDIVEMEKGFRKTTSKGKTITAVSRYSNFSELSLKHKVDLGIDTDNDYI